MLASCHLWRVACGICYDQWVHGCLPADQWDAVVSSKLQEVPLCIGPIAASHISKEGSQHGSATCICHCLWQAGRGACMGFTWPAEHGSVLSRCSMAVSCLVLMSKARYGQPVPGTYVMCLVCFVIAIRPHKWSPINKLQQASYCLQQCLSHYNSLLSFFVRACACCLTCQVVVQQAR